MEENKMAKLTTEEFIEAIKELSVLELNDLVKACEEEFGVSAAAGVVVAAAGAEGGAAAEEKDEFDVELVSAGAAKVKVIKVDGYANIPRRELDGLVEYAQRYGAKGLAWIQYTEIEIKSPFKKFYSEETFQKIKEATNAQTQLSAF
jgi:large subunit ribosomal protein L7/L12